jgi:hypothetical protein
MRLHFEAWRKLVAAVTRFASRARTVNSASNPGGSCVQCHAAKHWIFRTLSWHGEISSALPCTVADGLQR